MELTTEETYTLTMAGKEARRLKEAIGEILTSTTYLPKDVYTDLVNHSAIDLLLALQMVIGKELK